MDCLWARATMEGARDPWAQARNQLQGLASDARFFPEEVGLVLSPANEQSAGGSGYVLDTLWTARAAVSAARSYEECVRLAIRFGHDTDTTAAVAGGIAGLQYGLQGIPERWRAQLRGESIYAPLLERLLVFRESG
jgi:hypothetical protein